MTPQCEHNNLYWILTSCSFFLFNTTTTDYLDRYENKFIKKFFYPEKIQITPQHYHIIFAFFILPCLLLLLLCLETISLTFEALKKTVSILSFFSLFTYLFITRHIRISYGRIRTWYSGRYSSLNTSFNFFLFIQYPFSI